MKNFIITAALLLSTTAHAGGMSLTFSGRECADQLNTNSIATTNRTITSTIEVIRAQPNNIFEVKVWGGVPRLDSRGNFACIETHAAFGHTMSNSDISIFNKIVLPRARNEANALAWYNTDDNVVISIPAIRFILDPSFDDSLATTAGMQSVNTLLILEIVDGRFNVIELVRSINQHAAVAETDNELYKDAIIDSTFEYSNVHGVTYVVK